MIALADYAPGSLQRLGNAIPLIGWQHPLAHRIEKVARLPKSPDTFLELLRTSLRESGYYLYQTAGTGQKMIGAAQRRWAWLGVVGIYAGFIFLVCAFLVTHYFLQTELFTLFPFEPKTNQLFEGEFELTQTKTENRPAIIFSPVSTESPSLAFTWRLYQPILINNVLLLPIASEPIVVIEARDSSGNLLKLIPIQEYLPPADKLNLPLTNSGEPLYFLIPSANLAVQILSDPNPDTSQNRYNVQVRRGSDESPSENFMVAAGETFELDSLFVTIAPDQNIKILAYYDPGLVLYIIGFILVAAGGVITSLRAPIQIWLISEVRGMGGQLFGVVEKMGTLEKEIQFMDQLMAVLDLDLDQHWPIWSNMIRNSMLRRGVVTSSDLQSIPPSYQEWALQKYFSDNQETYPLDLRQDRLRLLADDRPRRWLDAWEIIAGELTEAQGLTDSARRTVDRLAKVFSETFSLGLTPLDDWATMRAFAVQALNLRLNIPPSFPLIFLAESRPGKKTVKMLSDYVDTHRETGYFALIVPLEPVQPSVVIPAELRRRLNSSTRVDDFIILSRDDVLDILSARDPIAALVGQIVSQVDLNTISPFQDSGPCPPNMFFGREREIKRIIEGVVQRDFAIVGNRKAGKTSLLQQVYKQLNTDNRFYPLLINCQSVYDTAGFYREFERVSGLALAEHSLEAFENSIRNLCISQSLPILLLDELDALLESEAKSNEKLSDTWRKLAEGGFCHFVFVGTATMARRLRDPNSSFYNFPQPMLLKYLPVDVAESVIAEPMAMLGLTLEPHAEVLKYVLDLTSGHPNLLQTLGRRLIENCDKYKRVITLKTCEAIARDSDFTDYYLDLTWGVVRPLEKLVTLVSLEEEFSVDDIESSLRRHKVSFDKEELDDALRMLEVYAILNRRNRQYTYNPKHFREIVQRTQDVNRLIDIEKRRLTKQRKES
jgi:hypothetical protein